MDFIATSKAKAAELQDQVKLLNEEFDFGIELTGEEKAPELRKIVSEYQKKVQAILAEDGDQNGDNNAPKAGAKKNAVFVWLKTPAYVDQGGEKRLPIGFYHIDLADFPRLEAIKRDKRVIEIFEQQPSRRLADVATFFGVSTVTKDGKERTDADLLETLLTEPKTF